MEAAAFHGRPVAFAVVGPWLKPTPSGSVARDGAGGWRLVARTVLPNVLVTRRPMRRPPGMP